MPSHTATSKWLSFVLRHDPASAGLTLDAGGWADVEDLLAAAPKPLDRDTLAKIIAENAKQRFLLSSDGSRIRANQGHSIPVDLGLTPLTPPDTLFHGTATRFLDAILAEGLTKQGRHHVHLSRDLDTARQVGQRHGKPVILIVAARAMHAEGHTFYQSENGVWLTAHVPSQYLSRAAG